LILSTLGQKEMPRKSISIWFRVGLSIWKITMVMINSYKLIDNHLKIYGSPGIINEEDMCRAIIPRADVFVTVPSFR